ncbi:MAG: LysR substrate-binding domain-containing protein [Albidovulum sp.]
MTLVAAVRHRSFTAAAKELNVTQSAVSHHIRKLEYVWELPLFLRESKHVTPTPVAEDLAREVEDFLNRIRAIFLSYHSDAAQGPLRISLLESVAARWLVPRLGSFRQRHAEIDVWISTSDELVEFDGVKGEVDLAIRLGHGYYHGLFSKPLTHDYLFPVCSPAVARKLGPRPHLMDIVPYLLLNRPGDRFVPTWTNWFRAAGHEGFVERKGAHFHNTHMALQAATSGQGIALARSSLVHSELKGGSLVRISNVCPNSPINNFLVGPDGCQYLPKIRAFIDWVTAEAESAQQDYDREIANDCFPFCEIEC